MKKLLITILILFFTINTYAIEKGEAVDFYVGGEYVQSMTYKQWKIFSESAKLHMEIIEAEKDGNIKVNFHKNPWQAIVGETFKTKIDFIWYKEVKGKEKVIKKLTIEQSIEVPKDGLRLPEYRVFYRDVAEIGFPISVIILLILMI